MAERIPIGVAYLWEFRAFLASDGKTPATGKTIAITISKNGGAFGNPNAGALNATEISSGFYKAALDTTDTGTAGPLAMRGAQADINDVGDVLYVQAPPKVDVETIKTQTVTCAAGVTVLASVGTAATSTAQTGDNYARLGAPAGASVSADVAAVKVDTAATLVDTGTTLEARFTGITSLAQWLGLLAGKQVGDATARTELRATGAGSGTYDETTDSLEAGLDSSATASDVADAVATELGTGAGFTTLSTQASVDDLPTNAELATALGTADDAVLTAIGDLPTNAELATALGTADDAVLSAIAAVDAKIDTIDNFLDLEIAAILAAVDTEVAAIKAKTDSLTFTVANVLDANIQRINDVTVLGDGAGTPWGP